MQAAHALTKFIQEHTAQYQNWYDISQHLGFLSVEDQPALERLCSRLTGLGITYSTFHEPDMGNALTAIAVEPTAHATRHLSSLPLAMKEYNQLKYAMAS